jgi:hypothetical protein
VRQIIHYFFKTKPMAVNKFLPCILKIPLDIKILRRKVGGDSDWKSGTEDLKFILDSPPVDVRSILALPKK